MTCSENKQFNYYYIDDYANNVFGFLYMLDVKKIVWIYVSKWICSGIVVMS